MDKAQARRVLNETINFYGKDPSRRATTGNGCFYLFNKEGSPSHGNKCAVGRCMTKVFLKKNGGILCAIEDLEERLDLKLDDVLLKRYRGFPITFWTQLQSLHDSSLNWIDGGLSEIGEIKVGNIKQKFEI